MKTKMILACAGMAACAVQAQVERPELQSLGLGAVHYPETVQAIKGITMDGRLVLGEEREYVIPANVASRGGITASDVYDAAGLTDDTDGDGFDEIICGDVCGAFGPGAVASSRWFFGDTFAAQAAADDFEMDAATAAANPKFSGFTSLINFQSCDDLPGNEPLILIFTMYDSVDLVADIDGFDGFDTDGDGVNDSPYARTDTDGDGLLDQFSGGVVVTFGAAGFDFSGGGYNALFAEELTSVMGGPLGEEDFGDLPTGDRDGDGNPDGTWELFMAGSEGPDTDGDGVGDSGDIFNQFNVISAIGSFMLWGANNGDNSACGWGGANETSEGIIWGQGLNACTTGDFVGTGWSDGASDGGVVNNTWDPSVDVTDFAAVVDCPAPAGWALRIKGEGGSTPPCADTNGDGDVTPADFNAWIIAFNTQSAACDQNGDGLCTPADFNAWIINFNSGAPCP